MTTKTKHTALPLQYVFISEGDECDKQDGTIRIKVKLSALNGISLLRAKYTITVAPGKEHVYGMMQRDTYQGRRYFHAQSESDAQIKILKWARRNKRFERAEAAIKAAEEGT